ncbi:TPA: hypothetical protein DCZ39_06525 [Patescibacteria group bacterium]|nr:hypothetical protein [Candidatus Gracilibacteria bacterium]
MHEGIVVFCHFEPEDNEKIILQAVKKLQSIVKKELILVPFAHLYEKTASKEEAKILFEMLIDECKKNEKWNIITIPFGVEKEFFLYAPADDSAIKFSKFTNKSKQKEIVNLYDLCYIDYDKHMSETGHYKAQEKILSSIINYIKEPILDLACGT